MKITLPTSSKRLVDLPTFTDKSLWHFLYICFKQLTLTDRQTHLYNGCEVEGEKTP